MNDVTKRFFETIEALGETPYRIAKNVPVASSAKLSNAKNGLNEIGLDVVSGVCEYYRNINGNYILTGRGTPLIEDNNEIEEEEGEPQKLSEEVKIIRDRLESLIGGKTGKEREQAAAVLVSFFDATVKVVEMFSRK